MATITSLGIGSGADLNGLVSQLVAVERKPLEQMRSAASGLQTQVSSYGKLSGQLSALQTAANKLNASQIWSQSTAKSSDDSAVSVVGGSSASAGNYTVSVSRLATSQTVVQETALPLASELVGQGTMTLQLGQWKDPPMNFLPQVGSNPVTLEVTAMDSMETLRDKINGLGMGITAALVNDSTGVRLSLRSTQTGEVNGFRLQANDADGNNTDASGLSRFAFDPQGGTTAMTAKTPAANSVALVNGIEINSASNELNSVVEGLSLRLRKANTGNVDVAVSSDREGVKSAIQGFADSYNDLARSIAEQTRYDATSKQGGPLQGDSAVASLQRQLRTLVNGVSGASGSFPRLSDIGLQLQRDGTLKVDSGKLDRALSNLPELKKAFSNNDSGNAQNNGFARRYAALASAALGVDGVLTTRTGNLQKLLSKNSEEQTRLNERVDRFQRRMVAQYTALDGNLARLNALSSSVTQQLNQLNKSNDR